MALDYPSKRLIMASMVGGWLVASLTIIFGLRLPPAWIAIRPIGALTILFGFAALYGFPGARSPS